MALYQLTDLLFATGMILRTSDGAMIPGDPTNKDYMDYLAWVADGNTADPAPPDPTQGSGS